MTVDWKKFIGLFGQTAVDYSKNDTAAVLGDVKAIILEAISEAMKHPTVGPKLVSILKEADVRSVF